MKALEYIASVILESMFGYAVETVYGWLTGKKAKVNGYRTEYKQYIKFSIASKFLIVWETDLEHIKEKLSEGIDTLNEKLKITDFQLFTIGQQIIIRPPASISFYSFHFLVQWIDQFRINTVGLVETSHTAYTVYSEDSSGNLIGQTAKGKKFFITLTEDYSRRQFLRINRDLATLVEYNVEEIRQVLRYSQHPKPLQ